MTTPRFDTPLAFLQFFRPAYDFLASATAFLNTLPRPFGLPEFPLPPWPGETSGGGAVVNAGLDQTIGVGALAQLNGTVDLTAFSGVASVQWSMVSGPSGGVATFLSPSSSNTAVSFSIPGDYVLRLIASDAAVAYSDDVLIRVTAASTANLLSIDVVPISLNLAVGEQRQIMALGNYDDGTQLEITGSVSWLTTVPNVAEIDSAGLVTGVSIGTDSIFARDDASGVFSTAILVTVGSGVPDLLTVDPVDPNGSSVTIIEVGTTVQMTAIGDYSDGSSADLTNQVVWSSSNPQVAGVDNNGLVTGISQGTVSIDIGPLP